MALGKSELKAIQDKILENLSKASFKYTSLEIIELNGKLYFKFTNITHPYFKNIVIISHDCTVQDTSLFTKVFINLRFLYNNRKSPIIGHNLTTIKLTLS